MDAPLLEKMKIYQIHMLTSQFSKIWHYIFFSGNFVDFFYYSILLPELFLKIGFCKGLYLLIFRMMKLSFWKFFYPLLPIPGMIKSSILHEGWLLIYILIFFKSRIDLATQYFKNLKNPISSRNVRKSTYLKINRQL